MPDRSDDRHLMPLDAERGLYWLRALGRGTLPETFDLRHTSYVLVQTIKHDFYAATGIYRAATGVQVVLKVNRTTACGGAPLAWLGRVLRDREVRFYRQLADLPNIPRFLALAGDTGFVHEFVSGEPLSTCRRIPDGFFDRLLALFRQLHARQVAYVDAHKKQNILVGDDGRPYLVDFQISADLHAGNNVVTRWLLRQLQWLDTFNALKHKSRLRPDELTAGEKAVVDKKSLLIRIHRTYATPYQKMLERVFQRWERAGKVARNGIE